MTRLKMTPLFIIILLVGFMPAHAQSDDTSITLVAFTNTTHGIAGIVPDGWREIAAGTYVRASVEGDVATLIEQSAPTTPDEVLSALLPRLGLSEAPENTGDYATDQFTWALYQVEVETLGVKLVVDLALAEAEGTTYFVLLQAAQDEYETLHAAVFLPVLDALAPYTGPAATEVAEDLPYLAEEVTFGHDDVTLAGTLTLPDTAGPHPAVILITGSGLQDRDESIAPLATIKPFYLIADYLTRAGIAVLRYDDRSIGGSTGEVATATSADFADDTEAALDYLLTRPEIDSQQIGLLGHSEGGLITAMIGARRPEVAFIISMAGPSVDGRDTLIVQMQRIMQADGASEETLAQVSALQIALLDAARDGDAEAVSTAMYELVKAQLEALPEGQAASPEELEAFVQETVAQQLPRFQTNWMMFFLSYNPAEDWARIKVPVLVLLGGLDAQVDADQHKAAYEAVFQAANHPDYTIITFPTANHLFQDAVTGSVEEYGTLKQEFLPDFLPTITAWLLERVTIAT